MESMITRPSVYLAGQITGLDYEGATDWRDYVSRQLHPDIVSFSPMRGKLHLLGLQQINDVDPAVASRVISTQRAIMRRDYFDAHRADAIFVNFLGATRASLGTAMELAWAYQDHKPVIAVMERVGNVHDHGMIREAISHRVETLEEGIAITRSVLLPDEIDTQHVIATSVD